MAKPRLRPVFDRPLRCEPRVFLAELARRLSASGSDCRGQIFTQGAILRVVGSDDKPIATAVFDSAAGTMRVKLDVAGDPDVVPEFWVIPADGTPRSLGRTASGDVKLSPEQQRLVFAGGAFAVSMEPDDGQASATPRGTVLGAGAIQLL